MDVRNAWARRHCKPCIKFAYFAPRKGIEKAYNVAQMGFFLIPGRPFGTKEKEVLNFGNYLKIQHFLLRSKRDSNPRSALGAYTLSRGVQTGCQVRG